MQSIAHPSSSGNTAESVPSLQPSQSGVPPPSAINASDSQESQAFLTPGLGGTSTKRKTSASRKRQSNRLTSWWFELVSLLAGIGALIAIVVTLAAFNAKEQPKWKYSVSLNTLIAILATFLRVCMLVGVEEAISQTKWLWYLRPRPLRHIARFDAAARGPWGSILLLLQIRRLDSVLVGCLVVIFSIGVGPFTQQAIRAVPCDVLTSVNSSIEIARVMNRTADRIAPGYFDIDMGFKAAILQGLVNPNSNTSAIVPSCTTGNCTFPTYSGITHSSIGMCKRCFDTTSFVREAKFVTNATSHDGIRYTERSLILPMDKQLNYDNETLYKQGGALGVGGGKDALNYTGQGRYSMDDTSGPNTWLSIASDAFPEVKPYMEWLRAGMNMDESLEAAFAASQLNVSMIALTAKGCEITLDTTIPLREQAPDWRPYNTTCSHPGLNLSPYWNGFDVVSTTCTFYPCVRNYHGIMKDSTFEEILISEVPVLSIPSQVAWVALPDHQLYGTPCVVDGKPYSIDNASTWADGALSLNNTSIGGHNASVPSQCLYHFSGVWLRALSNFLEDVFSGGCSMPTTSYFRDTSGIDTWRKVTCGKQWWLKSLYNSANATFDSVNVNMESVAIAISNEMRRQGRNWDGSSAYVNGTTSRAAVCTQFDWAWLAFPAALLMLTTVMLCIVFAKTLLDRDEIPVWKSSALPLLFTGNGVGVVGTVAEMENIEIEADRTIVQLTREGETWEFVGGRPDECEVARGNDACANPRSSVKSRMLLTMLSK